MSLRCPVFVLVAIEAQNAAIEARAQEKISIRAETARLEESATAAALAGVAQELIDTFSGVPGKQRAVEVKIEARDNWLKAAEDQQLVGAAASSKVAGPSSPFAPTPPPPLAAAAAPAAPAASAAVSAAAAAPAPAPLPAAPAASAAAAAAPSSAATARPQVAGSGGGLWAAFCRRFGYGCPANADQEQKDLTRPLL
ncbi:hypothetical protein FOA52_010602 [Chlamydomonas sp. UWO 241]|nr:hypothetical protein FOA52_010602 [Chlamydomonas sp. UWO 241]